jgi:hypothetical protein
MKKKIERELVVEGKAIGRKPEVPSAWRDDV